MATDTITVVPTGFGWSTTAYSMQYQWVERIVNTNTRLVTHNASAYAPWRVAGQEAGGGGCVIYTYKYTD